MHIYFYKKIEKKERFLQYMIKYIKEDLNNLYYIWEEI